MIFSISLPAQRFRDAVLPDLFRSTKLRRILLEHRRPLPFVRLHFRSHDATFRKSAGKTHAAVPEFRVHSLATDFEYSASLNFHVSCALLVTFSDKRL
ncbi:hypothetical protein L596_023718 [Steinernema carpocapsae]|uniref:Uncharacterized protein n=1 Tax=Steinernema carpocapsae TaxID=34508 RepID=A0A4U5MEH0_STECR|nr:hypothetical protein L596_023718 [Steinernema carpocapsae]